MSNQLELVKSMFPDKFIMPSSIDEHNMIRYDIDEDGNVIGLDLSCNELEELPKEIAQLTRLQLLDLSNNSLRNLPPEIGLLKYDGFRYYKKENE